MAAGANRTIVAASVAKALIRVIRDAPRLCAAKVAQLAVAGKWHRVDFGLDEAGLPA
jgi:hypothetical protein